MLGYHIKLPHVFPIRFYSTRVDNMYIKYREFVSTFNARINVSHSKSDVLVEEFHPINVNSYWDGGSKSSYQLVNLETWESWSVPTSHPYFDRKPNGERCGQLELRELPPNCVLLCGGYFMGKASTLRVMVNPANLTRFIGDGPQEEVSERAVKALDIICGIKSSYRKEEFDRKSLGEYNATNPAIEELAQAGLVKIDKRGGVRVTTDGRNYRSANRR